MTEEFDFPIEPVELRIEVTQACNLSCAFCYLGKTRRWRMGRHMPEDEVLHWIDWAVDNGIPAVRFTGGEAALHPDIKVLCNYAHLQKRWVVLNTNGMAEGRLYDNLLVNDVHVSVPTLDDQRMDDITGGTHVLPKKLETIDRLRAKPCRRLIMHTVMAPELIGKLHEFIPFLQDRPEIYWWPLRFESSPENPRPVTREQMQALAEEMAELMDRHPKHVSGIGIAAPFCSVSPKSLGAKVFVGRIRSCGPYKALNVNFEGRLTACFGICELFRKGSLEDVKKSTALHDCCSPEALPQECRECKYVLQCGGGCRKPAALAEHNGKLVDYLADFVSEEQPSEVAAARLSPA